MCKLKTMEITKENIFDYIKFITDRKKLLKIQFK